MSWMSAWSSCEASPRLERRSPLALALSAWCVSIPCEVPMQCNWLQPWSQARRIHQRLTLSAQTPGSLKPRAGKASRSFDSVRDAAVQRHWLEEFGTSFREMVAWKRFNASHSHGVYALPPLPQLRALGRWSLAGQPCHSMTRQPKADARGRHRPAGYNHLQICS